MDINNNQQTNTFIKGMDMDTSDMYIGEGSYRYAENLRVVTDGDSNSGELHIIEGTTEIAITPSIEGRLLGFTSIREYAIAIVYHENKSWSIYKITAEGNATLVAGPFTEKIWPDGWVEDSKTKPLSLVTRWESDDNVKLYIANPKTELLLINIAKPHDGESFAEAFQLQKSVLEPIKATLGTSYGATIPGIKIQYAYVTYKVNGRSSSMSILSNVVTEGIDNVTGFGVDENATKIINLTLPNLVLHNYVRVYRIAYPKAGQLPRVDIIYDQKCEQLLITDSGQSLENLATAEFLATTKLLFVAREIESKGDYLFAANIKYTQDDIDKKFVNFDARCYSKGSYYKLGEQTINIFDSATGQYIDDESLRAIPKDADLHQRQFDNAGAYSVENWGSVRSNNSAYDINGHGLCFEWKYIYGTDQLYYNDQYKYKQETPKTYARNEVYRFGVILYDEEGNKSSVKWIADIKMPDYFNPTANDPTIQDYIEDGTSECLNVHNLSIRFLPINVDTYWQGISKYEIVQAARSIDDSYKICQGICGYPIRAWDENSSDVQKDQLCVPYYLTTQKMEHLAINSEHDWKFLQDKESLIYASPEYSYLPDDILAIVNRYKTGINCKTISFWSRPGKANAIEGNNIRKVVSHPNSWPNYLNPKTSLGVDVDIAGGQNTQYSVSSWGMAYFNDHQSAARFSNLGGPHDDRDCRKMAFFTNMPACNLMQVSDNYVNKSQLVKNVTYYEPTDPDNFAKDENATYKNKFKTLHNGKKFYNWTNPAMFIPVVYDVFRGVSSNDEAQQQGWKACTMSSYDEYAVGFKYLLHIDSGDWKRYNEIFASCALSLPMAPGGSGMILEFDSEITGNFPEYIQYNGGDNCILPPITMCNLCKSATPYGGYNVSAINKTSYTSQGYVEDAGQPMTVQMGDNYITMYVYYPYYNFDNAQHDCVISAAMQYIVPVESTIDLAKLCSKYVQITHKDDLQVGNGEGSNGEGTWIQHKPSTVASRFTQTTDMYLYNTAYSVVPNLVTYSGEDTVNKTGSVYDSRVHYSQKKQNNELIDNWTNFKAVDFLDVDSRYGEITGLKLFKDKLIFLQQNGAGVLSVNDRTIIKDASSANIILGSGGVLDRFDYFTTIYGMKPDQHAVEVSNDSLYWWDGYRKEILSYIDGYNVQLLLRIKNVRDFINNRDEAETPSIAYDVDNKEVLFNVVGEDNTLVYNEQTLSFTSVYTFSPVYYCNINGKILMTDKWQQRPNLYEYNTLNNGVTLFGEAAMPVLTYIVNKDSTYNKVFDLQTFGGRFYKGDTSNLNMIYHTPLMQMSHIDEGRGITNREFDYRLAIPRNNDDAYGGRMRGKTMECTVNSTSNDYDFSIQYVTTKYRMSWT